MFGSGILDVAISIVFIYLLASLLCSAINEWIVARFFALRARTLEDGIRTLLRDFSGSGLTRQLYAHPLIRVLAKQGQFDTIRNRKSKPSYIPSHTFARALLDIVAPVEQVAWPRTVADIRSALAYPQDAELQQILVKTGLQKTLLLLLEDAQDDLGQARKQIAQWFDDTMERVTGWYKRKVQLVIIGIAFVLALALNLDTLMLIRSLSRDTVMRASIVAAAQTTSQSPLPPASNLRQIQQDFQQLQPLTGWTRSPGDTRTFPRGLFGLLAKLGGLLCTTIAVSLGAPFWFDVLNKFMSFRSVGRPPEPHKDAET